jgi:hypothetical protein
MSGKIARMKTFITSIAILSSTFLFSHFGNGSRVFARDIDCDLLVVGGSEGGVAAAVQAARLGVKKIALVNDVNWLGGQFTAEGLGAIDEWTIYHGKRVAFPRSGMFLEIINGIEEDNLRKYKLAQPGNCFCAWLTCAPRDTERVFRRLIGPYLDDNDGPIELVENYQPSRVIVEKGAVVGATFRSTKGKSELTVRAKITIDASDLGDVVRLSGAKYLRGPDLKSRFGEPSAPADASQVSPNELNPLTYCLVLRESEEPTIIDKPPHYDERGYFGTTTATRTEFDKLGWPADALKPFAPAWKDTTLPEGPYTGGPTVYHHRRLVDRRHNKLTPGTEAILINWPLQDYPTDKLPQRVVDELEALEPGLSKKNLVDMEPHQRQVIFNDAKRHALAMLYHLQTTVHERQPAGEVTFRSLRLTDSFGTPDKLPLKPYLREGLRTEALYMLREQDVRDTDGVQSWAAHMVPDSVFGFQFNIDFHPTRRVFLNGDPKGPWTVAHTKDRNWSTHTDRAGFPLRSLVPVEMDRLLVAGKNLGMTSLVQSAVRLHAHGMHSGQASGTIAALCLAESRQPREAARDLAFVRRVQTKLLSPAKSFPGVLLWPYQDVPPKADHFVAANQLAIRSILPGDPGEADFHADRVVTRRELARAICRAALSVGRLEQYDLARGGGMPLFADVGVSDPDLAPIETLGRTKVIPLADRFLPNEPATKEFAASVFQNLGWPAPSKGPATIRRGEFANLLWKAIVDRPEVDGRNPDRFLSPGADGDSDGIADLEDALPFDRDNNNLPDHLDPDSVTN